jgi:DNA-binding HxlR family transcriptional regulator
MAERDQLGLRALRLLAATCRTPGTRWVIRRLRGLLKGRLVSCEHQPGVPPHPGSAAIPGRAYYALTDAGRMLIEVTAEADRWERRWYSQLERGRDL